MPAPHVAEAEYHVARPEGLLGLSFQRFGEVCFVAQRPTLEKPKLGSGTIVRAGDQFVILSDTGELQLAIATSKEFKIKHSAQIVGRPIRSYLAIADGFAYITGPRQLVCVDRRANPSRRERHDRNLTLMDWIAPSERHRQPHSKNTCMKKAEPDSSWPTAKRTGTLAR